MTFRGFERALGWEIAGRYNEEIHSALLRPPIAVWREHEASLALRMPKDRMAFWVSFLPDARRTLRPDGIWLHGIPYWSNTLSGRVGRTKGELLIKFDPRDVLFAIHLTLTDSLSIRIRCRNGAQAERFSRIRELICAIMIGPIENSPTVAFRVSSRR